MRFSQVPCCGKFCAWVDESVYENVDVVVILLDAPKYSILLYKSAMLVFLFLFHVQYMYLLPESILRVCRFLSHCLNFIVRLV